MKIIKYLILVLFINLFLSKINAYTYKIGDKVKYNNINFYVIGIQDDNLVLIKSSSLLKTDIDSEQVDVCPKTTESDEHDYEYYDYFYKTRSTYLYIPYLCGDDQIIDYNNSVAKRVVDYWVSANINASDLVEDNKGYKSRLIMNDDISNFSSLDDNKLSYNFLNSIESTWTMDANMSNEIKILQANYVSPNSYQKITPVINIPSSKVELISKKSDILNWGDKEFKTGDKIVYNGVEFFVLRDSGSDNDSVTLIKNGSISRSDMEKYLTQYEKEFNVEKVYSTVDGKEIKFFNRVLSDDKILYCEDPSKCDADYDNSFIKYIVDKWSEELFGNDNLVADEYGYKSRILNKEDLVEHLYYGNAKKFSVVPVTAEYDCWTMAPVGDSSVDVFVQSGSKYFSSTYFSSYAAICPVVTVKKGITNGGYAVEVAKVPDTLKKITIFIVIGVSVAIISIIVVLSILKKKHISKNNN